MSTRSPVVLTEGDGRVYPEWDERVVEEALAKDAVIDANGYVAPASVLPLRRG